MSNTFVPFNFNPSATAVYTNNETYTVPANKFANVQIFPNLNNDQGTVSLNGDVFFKSAYIWRDDTSSAGVGTISLVIPSDVKADIWSYDTTGGLNSVPSSATNEPGINYSYSGSTISHDSAVAGKKALVGAGFGNQTTAPASIWVKAGDAVAISALGDINVVVMEYDVPS
jgi:hypothetical protein